MTPANEAGLALLQPAAKPEKFLKSQNAALQLQALFIKAQPTEQAVSDPATSFVALGEVASRILARLAS